MANHRLHLSGITFRTFQAGGAFPLDLNQCRVFSFPLRVHVKSRYMSVGASWARDLSPQIEKHLKLNEIAHLWWKYPFTEDSKLE